MNTFMDKLSGSKNISEAQHIWAMLDDMAQSDPQAYKNFVDKQMEEGRKAMSPPRPHMCIETKITSSYELFHVSVYVNICEWDRLPEPKSDEDPIPCVGGPLYELTDEQGKKSQVACVAFGSTVLADYGRNSKKSDERRMLVNLCLDYIEDAEPGLTLSRNYVQLPDSQLYKGSLKEILQNLNKTNSKEEEAFSDQLSELEQTFGPIAAGCKDSLLNKMATMCSTEDNDQQMKTRDHSENRLTEINKLNISDNSSTVTKTDKSLIEELSTQHTDSTTPAYTLNVCHDPSPHIQVQIELPSITSVCQCELDVTQTDVHLETDSNDKLHIALPQSIEPNEVKAKFHRKTQKLTLTLPIVT